MNVECTSSVTAEPGDVLTVSVLEPWLAGVPSGARLTPILRETGTQRDPITTLAGLRASWSEQR